MKNQPITIDLSNLGQFLQKEDGATRGLFESTYTSTLLLPVPDSEDQFFGKILLKEGAALIGKIIINTIDEEEEEAKSKDFIDEDPDVGEQVKAISLEFDATAAASFEGQGELPLTVFSDIATPGPSDEEDDDEESEIVLEETIEIEDEDEPVFTFFHLPSESFEEDEATSRGLFEEPKEVVFADLNRRDLPGAQERGLFGGGKKFVIRIFKNGLKKQFKKAKKRGLQAGLPKEELIPFMIEEVKKTAFMKKRFRERHYYLSIYNRGGQGRSAFPKIDISAIDPAKKTLILVPGTFNQSFKFKKRKTKGSFATLLEPYDGHINWLDHLLDNSSYEQVITLDHETSLHDVKENVEYLANELGMNGFRFEQPTAMIATSRGGMLAKYLMLLQNPNFADRAGLNVDMNLNVEKFTTVASGYSGYMQPQTADEVKKGIEIFFSFLNFFTGGVAKTIGGVFSLSVDVLSQMPGLKMQVEGSPQNLLIQALQVDGLTAMPFANNFSGKNIFSRFIERKVVDKFLGEMNDFVIGYDSQFLHSPGEVVDGFGVVKGEIQHGKGLKEYTTKKEIIRFLTHPNNPQPPSGPTPIV